MSNLLLILEENLIALTAAGGTTTVTILIYRYLVKSVIPQALRMFGIIAKDTVQDTFGIGAEEAEAKMPWLKTLDEVAANMQLQNEQKIEQYERLLASPLYTDEQKANIIEIRNATLQSVQNSAQPVINEFIKDLKPIFNAYKELAPVVKEAVEDVKETLG